jgi:hypothetical protein
MVETALQTYILGLLRAERPLPVGADADVRVAAPPPWDPGETVGARVAARLPDERVILEADGWSFQTQLPEGVDDTPGQRLQLRVVQTAPTVVFAIDRQEAGNAARAATRVSLSAVAARIAALVGSAAQDAEGAAALQGTPLLAAPPEAADALVQPLRHALDLSGLFYESHQAEWVGGRRSLEQVRQEPQARLAAAGQGHETATDAAAGRRDASLPGQSPSAEEATSSHGGTGPGRLAAGGASTPIAPGIAGIVERQLDAIATQQVTWRGEVWPGQAMSWTIEERRDALAAPDGLQRWSTELRLELPQLGAVAARMELWQGSLRVWILAAGGQEAVTRIRTDEPRLRAALEARGLPLAGFAVTDDGSA